MKNIIISTSVSFLTYPPLGCRPSVYRLSFVFPAYHTDVRNDPLLRLTSSVLLLHSLASAASIGWRQLCHLSKRHWFSSPHKIISRPPPWRRQTHSFISFPIFFPWYTHIFKHQVVSSDDSAQSVVTYCQSLYGRTYGRTMLFWEYWNKCFCRVNRCSNFHLGVKTGWAHFLQDVF